MRLRTREQLRAGASRFAHAQVGNKTLYFADEDADARSGTLLRRAISENVRILTCTELGDRS